MCFRAPPRPTSNRPARKPFFPATKTPRPAGSCAGLQIPVISCMILNPPLLEMGACPACVFLYRFFFFFFYIPILKSWACPIPTPRGNPVHKDTAGQHRTMGDNTGHRRPTQDTPVHRTPQRLTPDPRTAFFPRPIHFQFSPKARCFCLPAFGMRGIIPVCFGARGAFRQPTARSPRHQDPILRIERNFNL